MRDASENAGPLRFATEGEPIRRAAAVLEREQTRLAMALRRALPFLTRRDVPVVMEWTRVISMAELLLNLPRPIHVLHLTVEPGGSPGALVFDAAALARILDGVLGGDGRILPTLNPAGLSAPQGALVARAVDGVVRAINEVLSARADVRIESAVGRPEIEGGEGTPIVSSFLVGTDESGRVALVLPKDALLAQAPLVPAAKSPDQRVTAALHDIDIELVIELTRLPMKLSAVMALKVGDTIPLEAPVSGTVSIRADDKPIFQGRPTTASGRIAVRIEGGHDR